MQATKPAAPPVQPVHTESDTLSLLQIASEHKRVMVAAMRRFGGTFVRALADALAAADHDNEARLLTAFPDIVRRYGPGTEPYALVKTYLRSAQ